MEKCWNWFQKKTKRFSMTLHNTVRKIDCKSLLHTAFSCFLPIDKPLPIFCREKIHSKSPHYVSFLILRALLCHCWISPKVPLPPDLASLDRFGDSFVSDVDIIAYNNENQQEFFYFSFPHRFIQSFFPGRSFWVCVCVCTCYKNKYHVNKIFNLKTLFGIELLSNNVFFLSVCNIVALAF